MTPKDSDSANLTLGRHLEKPNNTKLDQILYLLYLLYFYCMNYSRCLNSETITTTDIRFDQTSFGKVGSPVYTKTAFLKDDVHRDAKDEVTSKHWGALARVTNAEQNYALCEFWSVPVGNFKFSTEKYATRGLGLFQRRHMFLLYCSSHSFI